MGLFNNSIELKVYDEAHKINVDYTFTFFASRNIAYKRIQMVWKAYLRIYNKKLNSNSNKSDSKQSESEQSSEDDDASHGFNRSQFMSETASQADSEIDLSNKEDVYFPPVDTEKFHEFCKIIIKIKTDEFYEKFWKDGAELSDAHFQELIGSTNVTITDWKEVESNTYIRDLNLVTKVKDVPFVTQTRVHKANKLVKDGAKYTSSTSSTSLDIPYSSYFHVEETWEIIPYEVDKTVLRY